MFLTRRKVDSEDGYAMVAAIATVAVSLTIALTVTTSTVSSLGYSTSSRASTQSRAAADAAVNYWLDRLDAGDYRCAQASFGGGYVGPSFTSVISYKSSTGSMLGCPSGGTVSGTPASATVVGTGYAASKGAGNSSGDVSRVKAEFAITAAVPATATVNLTQTVFAGSNLQIYNGAVLHESAAGAQDADIYSSGTVNCSSGVETVQGSVWAQGDITPSNQCNVTEDMWAGGNVTTQGGQVGGNLYVAGTGTMNWTNSGSWVKGNIVTNGAVALNTGSAGTTCPTQSASVCGSIVALGGGVTLSNGSRVGGSVFAKGEVALQNGAAKQIYYNLVTSNGNVTFQNGTKPQVGGYIKAKGTIATNGMATDTANSCAYTPSSGYSPCGSAPTFPALQPAASIPTNVGWPTSPTVSKPPLQTLPTAGTAADDVSLWTGAGYTAVTKSCTDARNYLNTMGYGSVKTLLIVTGCTAPLKWNDVPQPSAATYSTSGQKNILTLSADLAIINPSGFQFGDNTNAVRSSVTGSAHEVAFIVPTGSAGNIQTNGTVMTDTYTFFFTPNTISMQNSLTGFYGQIYGGTVAGPTSGSTLTMHKMNVPGIKDASGAPATPATPASATIQSRYLVTN